MFETKAFTAKQESIKTANPKVVFMTFEEAMKDNDFLHSGENRGINFSIEPNEVFRFPELNECVIYWSTFWDKQDKVERKTFKTLVFSSMRGWIEFPLAKFVYVPGQKYELDKLFTPENRLGKFLADAPSDPARLVLVAGKTIEAYHIFDQDQILHQNYWRKNRETGEREFIEDRDDLAYRKPLRAVQFKEVPK